MKSECPDCKMSGQVDDPKVPRCMAKRADRLFISGSSSPIGVDRVGFFLASVYTGPMYDTPDVANGVNHGVVFLVFIGVFFLVLIIGFVVIHSRYSKPTSDEKQSNESEQVEGSSLNSRTTPKPQTTSPTNNRLQNVADDNNKVSNRFWARSIDMFFIGVVATVGCVLLLTILEINNILAEILVSFVLINIGLLIYESTLISIFASTIGKSILGIRVVKKNGSNLELNESIARCFSILKSSYFFLFFPAITMFLVHNQIKQMKQKGVASWDEDSDTEVISHPIGGIRRIFGICLGIISLISVSVIHFASKAETKSTLKQQAVETMSPGIIWDTVEPTAIPDATAKPAPEVSDPETLHKTQILAKHPDAFILVPELEKWIAIQPEKEKARYAWVMKNGSAQEVIELLDIFKEHR